MDRLKEYQQYRFEDLPSLDRAEKRAVDEIARLAPGPEAVRVLRASFEKILHDLHGEEEPNRDDGAGASPLPERITIRNAGLASRDDWASTYSVRIIYGLGGSSRHAILELPLSSARSLIGRVVGVPAARLGASDLLSAVEQGILAFFAERLAAIADSVPFLAPLAPIPVLDIVSESASVPWGPDGAPSWYSISGSVFVVGTTLPFRLLLPWALLRQARIRYEESPEGRERAQMRSLRFLQPLSSVCMTLTGRLGTIGLLRAELEEVEPDDVVLLDDRTTLPGFEAGRLSGSMRLAFEECDESTGSIEVDVLEDLRHLTVCVKRLLPGDSNRNGNRRARMVDGNDAQEVESTDVPRAKNPSTVTPSHPEAAALAEEAPIQLRVELGRLRITIKELSELSPGAILELRKDPDQPVALMIEDRMVARGELVRIEGELGVRILSLY